MSMTAVPISIRLVRAPTAASSGNGDASCRAKWCTRKYAPSAPSSSAATARSTDCSSASDADRTCEPGDADQCPNDKKPIFFTSASTRAARASFQAGEAPAACCLPIARLPGPERQPEGSFCAGTGGQLLQMIARIWRGAVRAQDAAAYAAYVQRTGIEGYQGTPGNRGACASA